LQRTLAGAEDSLAQQGWSYPTAGRVGPGHHGIPRALNRGDKDSLDQVREAIESEDRDIIVSSENFCSLSIQKVQTLKELLLGREVAVVYFFLSWGPLLISSWQEAVKHGSGLTFFEFAWSHFGSPDGSDILNFKAVTNKFSEVFGRETLSMLPYEAGPVQNNIVSVFLEILGINAGLVEVDASGRANERMKASYTETVRLLNLVYIRKRQTPRIVVREAWRTEVLLKNRALQSSVDEKMDKYLQDISDISLDRVASLYLDIFYDSYEDLIAYPRQDLISQIENRKSVGRIISGDTILTEGIKNSIDEMHEIIAPVVAEKI
jgi:hypothetical protein